STAGFGGLLGILAHIVLSSTLLLHRVQPIAALAAGASGTLVMMASGFIFASGSFLIYLPLLAVFFGTAAYGRIATRVLGIVGTPVAALAIVSTSFMNIQSFIGVILFWFVLAVFVLAWTAGMIVYVNRGRRAAQTGEIRATVRLGEVT